MKKNAAVSIGVGAGIAVLIGAAMIFFQPVQLNLAGSQASSENTNLQLESGTSKPNEPIAVVDDCGTTFSEHRMAVTCNTKTFDMRQWQYLDLKTPEPLAKLVRQQGVEIIQGQPTLTYDHVTVYVYGKNDFEIGIKDQVGEKRYQTELWQLP